MKNEYLIHYGILGMKWGVRKNNQKVQDKKENKQLYRNALRNTKEFRKYMRSAARAKGILLGVSVGGMTSKVVFDNLRRNGGASPITKASLAAIGATTITSLATVGYYELKFRRAMKKEINRNEEVFD